MTCSVCNTSLKGKFCENCGQKYCDKKLSLKTVLSDVISSLTDVEKNVFLNIYTIIRFPKKVITNYWYGFSGYYYKPGKILFYFITIAGISSLLLGSTLFGLTFINEGISESVAFALVYFPILNLSSFLTYRKYKRNYIEHLVSTIYLVSTFGIIILIAENLSTYFSTTLGESTIWIMILTGFILLWNSILFTTPSKPIKIIFNAILELIVLVSIISSAALLLYFVGALKPS